MIVYRITLEKYANKLFAPGSAGRWNSQGRFVIYTGGSVSLACLENLVHTNAAHLQSAFKLMYIDIPVTVAIGEIDESQLVTGWANDLSYTRELGNKWLEAQGTCVLKIPSAIIQNEFNYILNPAHPHFGQIQLLASEVFSFDRRLKS